MSDFLSIVGTVVTIAAFGITIRQLVKTRDATDAARQAFERAESRLSANHLLILLPQLKAIEVDLDTATYNDDSNLAIRTLLAYSHAANQIAEWLEQDQADEHADIILELRSSATTASTAKAALVSGTKKPLPAVLKPAAERISALSGQAAGLTTRYQAKVS